jgi:hypothetical protein
MADQNTTDQTENMVPSPGLKATGDILWHCDVQHLASPDSDFQIVGIETLRDTIYITGGNNGLDPNRIHVWLRTGSTCQYIYSVNQPAASTGWGWRDIAADANYLYSSYSTVLNCFYVTPAGVTLVPANNITFAPLNPIRAVAYDPVNDWFWGANFSSNIYAFNRSGVQQASYSNTLAIYGLAFDNTTPGGPYLWCHVQDSCNIYQFSTTTGTYTGVVYSGWGDDDPGVSGIAGGLCVLEGNPSKGENVTLLGITQCAPFDEMYALEIYVAPTEACCLPDGSCMDGLTPSACQALGGTPQGPGTSCATVNCQQWPDHKMHYPQLPDPNGWDIVATMGYVGHPGIVTADDFMCTETGPITDIHFWGSWMWDYEVPILGFFLSIHDNIPAPPYSRPGPELWSAYVTDFVVTLEGQGAQGWYDPFAPWWEHPNHSLYFRYDIESIPEPFYQDSGTIYWLNIMADIGPLGYQGFPEPPLWGWKTSMSPHFEDDAVWTIWTPPMYDWYPLEDPMTGMSLDLAFVITTSGITATCGDVNNDGVVEVGDVVYLINYLFKGGPAPVPLNCVGDVNNDDATEVGDVVYLINYLFKGGAAPNPNCCTPPWLN